MPISEVPEQFRDRDDMETQITELAVRLFLGQGGAGELARLIGQQADLSANRRAEAARLRAEVAA
jgi:hypothetical protein